MNLMKLILFDFKQGIQNKYYKYIAAVIIYAFICVMFAMSYLAKNNLGEFSVIDVIVYFFRGEDTDIARTHDLFPSSIYMMLQILMTILVGNYCHSDLKDRARYVIIRTGERSKYFISKIIWAITVVVFSYIIMWCVVILFCAVFPGGSVSFISHRKILSSVCRMRALMVNSGMLIVHACLVPLLVQAALAVIQVCIEMVFNPLISYLIIMIVIILSAYYRTFLFVGNGFMLINNKCFEGGVVDSAFLVLFSIAIASIITVVTYLHFRRVDLM